jgi:hypothetical protein
MIAERRDDPIDSCSAGVDVRAQVVDVRAVGIHVRSEPLGQRGELVDPIQEARTRVAEGRQTHAKRIEIHGGDARAQRLQRARAVPQPRRSLLRPPRLETTRDAGTSRSHGRARAQALLRER